ncbi:MAG: hypothetical protein ABI363_03050 [Nitrosospira sp.]
MTNPANRHSRVLADVKPINFNAEYPILRKLGTASRKNKLN